MKCLKNEVLSNGNLYAFSKNNEKVVIVISGNEISVSFESGMLYKRASFATSNASACNTIEFATSIASSIFVSADTMDLGDWMDNYKMFFCRILQNAGVKTIYMMAS